MSEYTSKETLRIAKRFHNTKRTYLLVNPLQAKHIPVQPSKALEMMSALGRRLASRYPETRLVIGFAETATAIGAAVAAAIGPDCVYLHTTREDVAAGRHWIEFREEHSHAVEQKLCGDGLPQWLAGTNTVILVDDEISTGATLVNMVRALRKAYPALEGKQIVAASILNRVPEENEAAMAAEGVRSEYLVKLPQEDDAALVEKTVIHEAPAAEGRALCLCRRSLGCAPLKNPRLGLTAEAYGASCRETAEAFLGEILGEIPQGSRVVTLGTEECMYPALVLGALLEQRRPDCSVRCHATTRSPIGISDAGDYPIFSGRKLPSFYDRERPTYLYDMESCDVLIVVSDTPREGQEALGYLAEACAVPAEGRIFYLQGGQDVWYV